jgi:hypothetical protein
MAAISISNAVDLEQRDARKARYLEIVKRYQKDEIKQFRKMLGELIKELEVEPSDVLAASFMSWSITTNTPANSSRRTEVVPMGQT